MKGKNDIDFQSYKAADFALDDTFIDWIKNPDSKHCDFWEDWCRSNTDKLAEIDSARILVLSFQFDKKIISAQEIDLRWQELQNGYTPKYNSFKDWKRNSGYTNFLRIAAILVLAVSFTFIFYNSSELLTGLESDNLIKKECHNGQKLSLSLPDGSNVKLNAATFIEYPENFKDDIREVNLQGEAFFEIQKESDRPFRVNVDGITTEVLGTSFNIKSYPESQQIQIALKEGKVKIIDNIREDQHEELILEKGQTITVDKESREFVVERIDQKDILSWKDGILNFEKISFLAAISEMERWYGVKFIIDEKAEVDPTWRLHGKFKNESLQYTLSVISYPDLFNYKILEDTVIIF